MSRPICSVLPHHLRLMGLFLVPHDPNRSQHLRRDQQGGAEAHPPAANAREHAQLPHFRKSVFSIPAKRSTIWVKYFDEIIPVWQDS